jgi:hypothetical protein
MHLRCVYAVNSIKDGGVFVHFSYTPDQQDPKQESDLIPHIIESIRQEADKQGGLPSWIPAWKQVQIWPVKGQPWMEARHSATPTRPTLMCHYLGYEPLCISHTQS